MLFTTTRQIAKPFQRMAIAAALLLTAALPGLRAPQATVESHLMASEGSVVASPIANAVNFASSAIALRHWGKSDVNVHIVPSENDNKTPEETKAVAAKAVGLWGSRFLTVSLHVTDAADADIEISFVQPGTLKNNAVGKTDTQFNPENNEISHSAIQINEGLSKSETEQAICHEMGHALGIQGHSTNKADLMYPRAHLPIVLTDRDINTLALGYAPATH